ncbi:MAG: hypothetical protein FWF76_01540 [Oscillospiraceae bacterium]|nr:hypothetical protein [Oscillospiraceae bacterium]
MKNLIDEVVVGDVTLESGYSGEVDADCEPDCDADGVLDSLISRCVETAVGSAVKKLSAVICECFESCNSLNSKRCGCEKPMLSSASSGEAGNEVPDKRVDFSQLSYSELCEFLESHPQARI